MQESDGAEGLHPVDASAAKARKPRVGDRLWLRTIISPAGARAIILGVVMTVLELWLIALSTFLWLSGGYILFLSGVALKKVPHDKMNLVLIIVFWPFAIFISMLERDQ